MKIRFGSISVQHGLMQSRERAKALIMAGVVFVNEQKVDKAGEMIKEDAKVEVRGHDIGYVSRGGLKLEKAMKCFPLTPNGKVCMDIGASTGGFTDCMLQNGAVKVYAVDVGYGQLAWSLRTDERVVNMERTNIRNVTRNDAGRANRVFQRGCLFISLHHIFPVAQASQRRTPWASAWSSRSLRLAAKRWAKTAWCATPPPTVRCCTMPWAMLLKTASWCAAGFQPR